MKKALAIILCVVAVCFASCNKEKPNQKFIGSYQGNSIVNLTISALGQTLPFDSITANVAMEITAGSADDKIVANFTVENETRTLNGTVNNDEISFEPLTVKENIEGKPLLNLCQLLDGGLIASFNTCKGGIVYIDPNLNSSVVQYSRRNIIYKIFSSNVTNKFFTIDGINKGCVWEY